MAYHSDKKMYRDKHSGKIAGVCAGLSEYFLIDVTIIRIIFLVLLFGYGVGLIPYIILWIALPEVTDLKQ